MRLQKSTKKLTAEYTTTDADIGHRLICASSAGFEIILHSPTGRYNFDLEIDNIGTGAITVAGYTILQHSHVHVGCDGVSWVVTGNQTEEQNPFDIVRPAAVSIGGHRIVALNSNDEVVYPTVYTTAIGLSINAASIGSDVNIITTGYVVESSWSWIPGEPLFLSTDGQISQTPPTSGILLQVGKSISATSIYINLQQPIQLN